jgi:hypothetical protein
MVLNPCSLSASATIPVAMTALNQIGLYTTPSTHQGTKGREMRFEL